MPLKEQVHMNIRHIRNVVKNEDIKNLESVISYEYYKIGSVNLIHKIIPTICDDIRVLSSIRYDTVMGRIIYRYIRDNGILIETSTDYQFETDKKYASIFDRVVMVNRVISEKETKCLHFQFVKRLFR